MPADYITDACNHVFGEHPLIKQKTPIYQAFAHGITVFEGWLHNDPPLSIADRKVYALSAYQRIEREVEIYDTDKNRKVLENFRERYKEMIIALDLSPSLSTDHRPRGTTGQQPLLRGHR